MAFTGDGYLISQMSLPAWNCQWPWRETSKFWPGHLQTSFYVRCLSVATSDFEIPHSFVPALGPLHMLFLLPETATLCLHFSFAVKPSLTTVWPSLGPDMCLQEHLASVVMLHPTLRGGLRLDVNPGVSWTKAFACLLTPPLSLASQVFL